MLGSPLVIENISLASTEVLTALKPILENRSLFLPNTGETIVAAPSFRIFATSEKDRRTVFFQEHMADLWIRIQLDEITHDELSNILAQKYPQISGAIPFLLQLYSRIESLTPKATLKNIMRLSERLLFASNINWASIEGRMAIFSEAFDCFGASLKLETQRSALFNAMASSLALLPEEMRMGIPQLKICSDRVIIGRIVTESSPLQRYNGQMALTSLSLSLMERISAAIKYCEPVLLTGETGTGKTSTIQFLASLHGQPKLTVINMSQQTESTDLLGGFRPVTVQIIARPILDQFQDLFERSFSLAKNAIYMEQTQAAFKSKNWRRFSKLIRQIGSKLTGRPDILSLWAPFLQKVAEFESRLDQYAQSQQFFAFVEGALVTALREGFWILLDEVNLASVETIELLSGIISSPSGSLVLYDRGDFNSIMRHPNFRLFACMNPSTDVNKKDLPDSVLSHFTEIYVDETDKNPEDLRMIVQLLAGPSISAFLCEGIVRIYYRLKKEINEHRIFDANNHRPLLNLRTIGRALSFARKYESIFGIVRSIFEGLSLAILASLHRDCISLASQIVCEGLCLEFVEKLSISKIELSDSLIVQGYLVPRGPFFMENEESLKSSFVLTPSTIGNISRLARAIMARSYPILLEGPTSAGKTSTIEYLAKITGHRFVRINNHEHTDVQEYTGSYQPDPQTGQLVFCEGLLVDALRNGYWLVLDELNLAPSDVLEALNRLLDDNRELYISETNQTIKPHPNFFLFATQNPSGSFYGGRKQLSRAFRSRFLEIQMDDIPLDEVEQIIEQKCAIAPSYAKRIGTVYKALQERRLTSANLFAGRHALVTLRDLFRWARKSASSVEELALNGYYVLAERLRHQEDCDFVLETLEKILRVKIDRKLLYNDPTLESCIPLVSGVVLTKTMKRLLFLVRSCIQNKEPVLLVGDTGCGKTTVCQIVAEHLLQRPLTMINCHQNTETSDFVGSLRPNRNPESSAFLFKWQDGPLVQCMLRGEPLLIDEISLADDSVLERLNSVLEPSCTLVIPDRPSSLEPTIHASTGFAIFATMNPGGDFGKKELSPALRNRFTEIWVPNFGDDDDLLSIIRADLSDSMDEKIVASISLIMMDFISWWRMTIDSIPLFARWTFSLRDLRKWTMFIKSMSLKCNALLAMAHAAVMLFVVPAQSFSQSSDFLFFQQFCSLCYSKLFELTGVQISSFQKLEQSFNFYQFDDQNRLLFGVEPFYISTALSQPPSDIPFSFEAPTTFAGCFSILRAMQLGRAILLEGSPGVGKSTIVSALARAAGKELVRINVSDQTDLIDLFGSDLPIPGGRPGEFSWHDGPFLRALKSGSWILLDELNLASQSVLEGLNACLDHRGTIYIPELDRTFYLDNPGQDSSRIFAAQNPIKQGGGRKGLPKSFVNRFISVWLDVLTIEDYKIICSRLFPSIDQTFLNCAVEFSSKLDLLMVDNPSFGSDGRPWEFNLRDLFRLFKLVYERKFIRPINLLRPIYIDRLRNISDRKMVGKLIEEVFGQSLELTHIEWSSTKKEINIGNTSFVAVDTSPLFFLRSQCEPLEALGLSINLSVLSIISGRSSTGKTSLIRLLAKLYDRKLVEFSVGPDLDTLELLGSFEQKDTSRRLRLLYHSVGGNAQCSSEKMIDYIKTFILDNPQRIDLSDSLEIALNSENKDMLGSFEWIDGPLIRAIEKGEWFVLDNANLCSPSVLDRLNSLCEPNGFLALTELASSPTRIIKPHPNFHLFMTVNPRFGELSRAMRNRGLEIALLSHGDENSGIFSNPIKLYDRINMFQASSGLPFWMSVKLSTFYIENSLRSINVTGLCYKHGMSIFESSSETVHPTCNFWYQSQSELPLLSTKSVTCMDDVQWFIISGYLKHHTEDLTSRAVLFFLFLFHWTTSTENFEHRVRKLHISNINMIRELQSNDIWAFWHINYKSVDLDRFLSIYEAFSPNTIIKSSHLSVSQERWMNTVWKTQLYPLYASNQSLNVILSKICNCCLEESSLSQSSVHSIAQFWECFKKLAGHEPLSHEALHIEKLTDIMASCQMDSLFYKTGTALLSADTSLQLIDEIHMRPILSKVKFLAVKSANFKSEILTQIFELVLMKVQLHVSFELPVFLLRNDIPRMEDLLLQQSPIGLFLAGFFLLQSQSFILFDPVSDFIVPQQALTSFLRACNFIAYDVQKLFFEYYQGSSENDSQILDTIHAQTLELAEFSQYNKPRLTNLNMKTIQDQISSLINFIEAEFNRGFPPSPVFIQNLMAFRLRIFENYQFFVDIIYPFIFAIDCVLLGSRLMKFKDDENNYPFLPFSLVNMDMQDYAFKSNLCDLQEIMYRLESCAIVAKIVPTIDVASFMSEVFAIVCHEFELELHSDCQNSSFYFKGLIEEVIEKSIENQIFSSTTMKSNIESIANDVYHLFSEISNSRSTVCDINALSPSLWKIISYRKQAFPDSALRRLLIEYVGYLESRSFTSKKLLNFYKDSSAFHAIQTLEPVQNLLAKIRDFLIEWPEHDVLQSVLFLCQRHLRLSIHSESLVNITLSLEGILRKSQDWQNYSSLNQSLAVELAVISELIIKFRKLELDNWKNIFQNIDIVYADSARKRWVPLAKIAMKIEDCGIMPLVDVIDACTLGSMVGEFTPCMEVISNLSKYPFLPLHARCLLLSAYRHFQILAPSILEHINVSRRSLEQELQAFLLNINWNDKTYYALSQSVDKSHKFLAKIGRRYREILEAPVVKILNELTIFDNLFSFENVELPSLSIYSFQETSMMDSFLNHVFCRLNRIMDLSNDLLSISRVSEFVQLIVDRQLVLHNLSSKDHVVVKQKAVFDLFRSLKILGIKLSRSVDPNTSDLKQLLIRTSLNTTLPIIQGTSYYASKCINAWQQFGIAVNSGPSEDLGLRQVEMMQTSLWQIIDASLNVLQRIASCSPAIEELVNLVDCTQIVVEEACFLLEPVSYLKIRDKVSLLQVLLAESSQFFKVHSRNNSGWKTEDIGTVENFLSHNTFAVTEIVHLLFSKPTARFHIMKSKDLESLIQLLCKLSTFPEFDGIFSEIEDFVSPVNILILQLASETRDFRYFSINVCDDSPFSQESIFGPWLVRIQSFGKFLSSIDLVTDEEFGLKIDGIRFFEKFSSQLGKLLDWKNDIDFSKPISTQDLRFGPVIANFIQSLITSLVESINKYLKLAYILSRIFKTLLVEGFCRPPPEILPKTVDSVNDIKNDGIGMAEGSGDKNVSTQIEFEEQVIGTENEKANEENIQSKNENEDGIDMEADFEGALENIVKDECDEDQSLDTEIKDEMKTFDLDSNDPEQPEIKELDKTWWDENKVDNQPNPEEQKSNSGDHLLDMEDQNNCQDINESSLDQNVLELKESRSTDGKPKDAEYSAANDFSIKTLDSHRNSDEEKFNDMSQDGFNTASDSESDDLGDLLDQKNDAFNDDVASSGYDNDVMQIDEVNASSEELSIEDEEAISKIDDSNIQYPYDDENNLNNFENPRSQKSADNQLNNLLEEPKNESHDQSEQKSNTFEECAAEIDAKTAENLTPVQSSWEKLQRTIRDILERSSVNHDNRVKMEKNQIFALDQEYEEALETDSDAMDVINHSNKNDKTDNVPDSVQQPLSGSDFKKTTEKDSFQENQSNLAKEKKSKLKDSLTDAIDDIVHSSHSDELQDSEREMKDWPFYEAATHDLAMDLCEHLKLILEPSMASKLRGDYKTGKRLNLRKIIGYIASQYRRDKIWLRRTKPSQRTYRIAISVDNSQSMVFGGCVELAYESIALISQALSRLEAGQMAVVGFGKSAKILHEFESAPSFSSEIGRRIHDQLRFSETGTDIAALLETIIELFEGEQCLTKNSASMDVWKLNFIISDGICQDHPRVASLVKRCLEARILNIFIILDSRPANESILEMSRVDYISSKDATSNMQIRMTKYLDTFPFEHYIVIREKQQLPSILADAIKQWFECIEKA